jgi:outer membrane protein insertion porin family
LARRSSVSVLALMVMVSAVAVGRGWSRPQAATSVNSAASNPAGAECFGSRIESIELGPVTDNDRQMLQSMIAVREGEALDRDKLRQSLRAMFATGRYATLDAACQKISEGRIRLSFVSEPNYFVGGISVEGTPGRPTESQVINASKLQLGEQFTSEKIDQAIKNILRLMEENDFYTSSVTHSERRDPETQQIEIAFHIHPGTPARVGKVMLQGQSIFSAGQLQDMGKLHPGDIVSAQKAADALERIRKKFEKRNRWLAQVSFVEKKYIPETNTVNYTIEADPGPTVLIQVEGFRLSRGTIRKNVPVYEENALDDDLLNEGRRNLLSYMESRGYSDSEVELRKESDPEKNMVRVIYHITPGQRHTLVKVAISGNQYFREEDLRRGMQVQEASLLLRHGRYSQALLRADINNIENQYKYNGFDQVKAEAETKDDYLGKKNQQAVILHIAEGPQTLVGKFHITGNNQATEDPLPPLNIGHGEPFSDARIAEDRDILLNYYFDNGFPNASFEATAKPAENNRMDVTYNIHEGERVYVDRVLVSGREFTRPYVIDRQVEVAPNNPLSQSDLLDTQQKLYDLGIFSQVETAIQNPEGNEDHKNVLVQVREAKRYTFNYGGGFEFQTGQPGGSKRPLGTAQVSPLASFDVTRLNFLGRAHTITFESRVGRLQQRGLISYEAPRWFGNPNWKLTFTGFFDHTLDVTTFNSQRLEGTVQAGQVINKTSTIDYRFNYRLVKATGLVNTIAVQQIPQLSQPVRLGEPGFAYIRNRRDNDLESTRGSYITADAGVAAHYFGSQADFSHLLIQYSTYHPFGKQQKSTREIVFARSTRVGVESMFGNTVTTAPGISTAGNQVPLPLPERFYMGGGNSHRGFGLNQAGPRDPATGFPLGGAALFLNSLELRLPPPTLPFVQDNMSFALFHDMGNVFTNGNDMLHSLLRWHQDKRLCSSQAQGSLFQAGSGASLCSYNYISHAIGLGVRYKTPVGPVRFDFGYNLNPPIFPEFLHATSDPNSPLLFNGTRQASPFNVYFSIGQTF